MTGIGPLETGVAALPSAIELAKDFARLFSVGARMVGATLLFSSTFFLFNLFWSKFVSRLEFGGGTGFVSSSESEDSMGGGGGLDCIERRAEEDLLRLLPSMPSHH